MVPYTFNHDNEYVNKYETKNFQGYSGMSNPTYGQVPMYKETKEVTYGPYPYRPESPITGPKYQPGWSKDFVKQCTEPMHEQYGFPPGMPYTCTFDYPMTKDIKWQVPTPVPTPMPVPVPVPVPMPIQGQWQQPQQLTMPMPYWQWQQQQQQPTGQWPIQWQNQYDLPYSNQWTKDMKYPVPLSMQYQEQYPIAREQPINWTQFQPQPHPIQFNQPLPKFPIGREEPMHFNQPMPLPRLQPMPQEPMRQESTGQRHTQVTTTKW